MLQLTDMLETEYIHFRIGEKDILRDISVAFAPARIHGVIGPNGAGKSSLLKIMCGIWKPCSGVIYLNRSDTRDIPRKKLSTMITLVPQAPCINFPISVQALVTMGRYPHIGRFQSLAAKDKDIIGAAMKTTGIFNLKDRLVTALSGGECQLAAIARALVTQAPVLLLDEPTSNLDIHHAVTIMELLGHLKREGKTIIVNIHDLNLAKRYCDTITTIHSGEVVYHGAPSDAFSPDKIQTVFNVGMKQLNDGGECFFIFTPRTDHSGRC